MLNLANKFVKAATDSVMHAGNSQTLSISMLLNVKVFVQTIMFA